jgi:hypothetical protein
VPDPDPRGDPEQPAATGGESGVQIGLSSAFAAFDRGLSRYDKEKGKLLEEYEAGGKIGRWIGDIDHHAGNIALITIAGLLFILLVGVVGLLTITESPEKMEDVKSVILAILGLTGTILGYIFGRSSKSQDERQKP